MRYLHLLPVISARNSSSLSASLSQVRLPSAAKEPGEYRSITGAEAMALGIAAAGELASHRAVRGTDLAGAQNLELDLDSTGAHDTQAVDGGLPPVPGDPSGQECADPAKDQPVEKNQGDDELIALELC